jgi:hypothetical protein
VAVMPPCHDDEDGAMLVLLFGYLRSWIFLDNSHGSSVLEDFRYGFELISKISILDLDHSHG